MATENKSSIASLEQAKKLKLMEENKRLYGTFIRERRKSMGMKQEDLAKLVGVKTISVTPWWETALNVSIYVGAGLSVVFLALYALSLFKGKKKEA